MRLTLVCVVLFSAAGLRAAQYPSLAISEFMAWNQQTLVDEDGDSSDWIEIYNGSDRPVNLEGYYLTDDDAYLTKWRFPAVTLQSGGYLLVFASGKDKRDPSGELHTNFRLSSGGEYLALVAPDGQTIIHQFSPTYPEQYPDYSYGVGQEVSAKYLLSAAAPLRFLVPEDDSLGRTWTELQFDDGSWQEGRNGIGYITSVPGFLVTNYLATTTISNLDVAEQVINNPDLQANVFTENVDVIDLHGTGGSGHYHRDIPFPGAQPGQDVDNYVIEATAIITFPEAGFWTFGVLSDDGFGLDISNGETSFRIEYPDPRGPGDTLGVFNVPAPGDYELRLVMYERGGGSTCELYAAQGSYTSWNDNFALVGDTSARGLPVRSLAGGTGAGGEFRSHILTDVEELMAGRSSSLYLRIPFEVADPGAYRKLFLRVRYDDGFVAYLNGVEVARRNAPGALSFDSNATADRPQQQAVRAEDINISFALSFLQSGVNLLAVQPLNDSPVSDDFLFECELADIDVQQGVANFFDRPTPGEPNAEGFLDVVSDTKFSVDRGFFTEPFDLEIWTDTPGATIRYTLDGTVPTPTHGMVYDGPIHIDKTTVVRAAAFKPGYIATNVDTQTYFFLDDVIRQDYQATIAAGFPTTWGGTSPDYGLDRRVAGQDGTDSFGGKYASIMKDSLRAIPTMSIVMNINDMFGPNGIYTNSTRRGVAWERPCSVELIYPDGSTGFQVDCGIRIQGGAFRNHSLTKKHSLRLLFKGIYGATKLRYPLFGPGAPDRFDTITLRANSNDGWQWSSAGAKPLYVRDSFARQTVLDMGNVASHEIFVHLYINGIYWGLYNPVERPDNAFSATYFGGDKEDWDAINHGQISEGNLNGWNTLLSKLRAGVQTNAAYFAVQGKNPDGTDNPDLVDYIDVENYVDYMIANLYTGNRDWPHKNYWIGWNRVESSGFKFYMWDAEWTLGLRSDLSTNQVGVNQGVAEPWPYLRQNPEFRMLVADRLQKYFFNGGPLYVDPSSPQWDPEHPERNVPAARFKKLCDIVELPVVAESARWGDQHGTLYTRDEHWARERDNLLRSYFPNRSRIVLDQFKQAGLYPDLEPPTFNKHGGVVDPGFVLLMTAPQGTVYYTLDGSDPRLVGGRISPGARQAATVPTVELVPENAEGRILVPTDGSLGLSWVQPDFDDSSWRQAVMGVGYERSSGYEEFIATDLEADMYRKNGSVYIRLPFQVEDPSDFVSLRLLVRYDDGYVAFLNGERIVAKRAPDPLQWNSTATSSHSDSQARLFEPVDLPDSLSLLRPGLNVLAIQGLNATASSSDMLIVPKLVAIKRGENQGVVITETTTVKARTYDAGTWSALVEATFKVLRPVDFLRITEIMYNPREEGTIDGDAFEFIELKNTGEEPIDLTGVHFVDGIQYAFPEGTFLAPGQFLVLVGNPDAFSMRYPEVPISGVYRGNLSNRGERLAIADGSGALITEVWYGDRPPWPAQPDGMGPSLVPVDPSDPGDPNQASWWRASTFVDGSPGVDDPTEGDTQGWQLPGDVNQDGRLDISDVVAMLRWQFGSGTVPLPCGGTSAEEGGNLIIFDINGDDKVNVADAVSLLLYLFKNGAPPARGTHCVFVEGCPGACNF